MNFSFFSFPSHSLLEQNSSLQILYFGSLLIGWVLSGGLIWCGSYYSTEKCDQPLQLWLMIFGVVWFICSLFRLLTEIQIRNEQEEQNSFFFCGECLVCIGFLFLLIWTVIGSVWMFIPSSFECPKVVWTTSLILLIFMYLILSAGFTLGIISCCICRVNREEEDEREVRNEQDPLLRGTRNSYENRRLGPSSFSSSYYGSEYYAALEEDEESSYF